MTVRQGVAAFRFTENICIYCYAAHSFLFFQETILMSMPFCIYITECAVMVLIL